MEGKSEKVLLDPPKFYLGATVTDEVTGLVGVADARIEYLDGTTQYRVQPPVDPSGGFREGVFIDQKRLDYHTRGWAVSVDGQLKALQKKD